MRHRVAWLSTAPLMLAGLLAGHSVGYRLAYSDPHARADALGHSGHSYFIYLPFALAISVAVLLAGLVLHAISAFRGDPRRPAASPVIVLLPPVAFVAQEVTERLLHTGQIPWTVVVQPAFLIGLALQLPFALAALLLAWALDFAARAVGGALAAMPRLSFEVEVPVPVPATVRPRVAGLARGYAERAPPLLRRP